MKHIAFFSSHMGDIFKDKVLCMSKVRIHVL